MKTKIEKRWIHPTDLFAPVGLVHSRSYSRAALTRCLIEEQLSSWHQNLNSFNPNSPVI